MRNEVLRGPALLPLTVVGLATLLAGLPLLEPGLISTRAGGDSPFLLIRLYELVDGLKAGEVPVRWMAHGAYGYGYPFFVYYGALPFYLAAVFHGLGWGLVGGLKLVQLAALVGAALGAFVLVRRLSGQAWPAALAAVAYTVAPFHLANVYVRGDSLTEFAAMGVYPWLMWLAARLAGDRGSTRSSDALLLALLYGALVASHNISALIFTPFLVLWVAGLGRPAAGLLALLGGVALSAWTWLPALAEGGAVRLEENLTGYFHYANHFRGLDLVQPSLLFDYGAEAGPDVFAMGLAQAVVGGLALAVAGLAAWRRAGLAGRPVVLLGLCTLLATWLVTPLSRPVWERLPLLPFVQFPWRLLGPQALFLACLTGLALLALPRPGRGAAAVGAGALLVVSSLAVLRPSRLPVGEVGPAQIHTFELVTSNVGSTVRAEYLAHGVEPRPWSSVWLVGRAGPLAVEGELRGARLLARRGSRMVWEVEAGQATRVAFPTHGFPGHMARVDGRPAAPRVEAGSGWLVLEVPPGRHRVELWLGRTRLRLAAELGSLVAFLVWVGLAVRAGLRPGRRAVAALTLGLVLLAATGRLAGPAWAGRSADGMVFDYDRQPFPHPGPPGLAYELPRQVEAGQPMVARLAVPGGGARLELVSPAEPLQGVAVPVAEGRLVTSGTVRLPVPADAPTGLHLVRLGETFVGWIEVTGPAAAEGLLARFGPADLLAVDTRPEGEGLWVDLIWTAREAMSQNHVIALRLLAPDGEVLARLDRQPNYGFDPTSLWPPGTLRRSRLWLEPAEEREGTVLEVVLYRAFDLRPLGPALRVPLDGRLRPAAPLLRTEGPAIEERLGLGFGQAIELVGASLERDGETAVVELVWRARRRPASDWVVFVHLVPRPGAPPASQDDGRPAGGTRPTTSWRAGEVVVDAHRLSLSGLPPGRYRLAVGLYDPATGERLAVSGGGDQVLLETVVERP